MNLISVNYIEYPKYFEKIIDAIYNISHRYQQLRWLVDGSFQLFH